MTTFYGVKQENAVEHVAELVFLFQQRMNIPRKRAARYEILPKTSFFLVAISYSLSPHWNCRLGGLRVDNSQPVLDDTARNFFSDHSFRT